MILLVALAGGAGAVARLLLDGLVSARMPRGLPAGTLAVNVSGAFLIGLLAPGDIVGTGLLGGYTTFSTWTFESHRLAEDGRGRWALANLVGSLALGLGAAALGRALA